MSKPLLTAFVAVFGLATLAGCHHHNRAETFTPVVETPAPEPTYSGKYR